MYMSLVRETEQMVIEAKRVWWEAEISRLEVASQNMKWKIVDRLTDPSSRMGIQPVKVNGEYVFDNEEILVYMKWKKFM